MVDVLIDPEAALGSMAEDGPLLPPIAEPELPKTRAPSKGSLERRLSEMFRTMGAGMMFVDPICGSVVTQQADELGKAFDTLAKENAQIRKWLEALLQTGAWSGVIQATLPIIFTVAAHHGMLNPEIAAAMGINVPVRERKERKPKREKGERMTEVGTDPLI